MTLLLVLILLAVGGAPLLVIALGAGLLLPVFGFILSLLWYVFLLYGPGWFLVCLALPIWVTCAYLEITAKPGSFWDFTETGRLP
jgi:hypothetical protein